MRNKAKLMQSILIDVLLFALVFALFFISIGRLSSKGSMQEILERELALFIDSARPGTEFVLSSKHPGAVINNIYIKGGRIFAEVNGLKSIKGHPIYSRHSVLISREGGNYVISIK